MSDNLYEAQLRVTVEQNIDAAITAVGKYNESLGNSNVAGNKAEKALNNAQKAFQGAGNAAKDSTSATNNNTAAQNQNASSATRMSEAQGKVATSTAEVAANLPRLRYALYDVSNSLGVAGAAMAGFAALTYKTSIDYQRDFANVQRSTDVTGVAAQALYNQLVGLSTQIPLSFADITGIATLAGQLGIASNEIVKFTEATAKFTATSGISTDAAGTALGRLNALLPDVQNNYNSLASSIVKVGVNSVATDSQIVAITTRIAGIGSAVGLTSDQVIGLSGALASIGVQPELAQGTITRVFTKIQAAIAGGGDALQKFAGISGMSAEQFTAAWKSNAADTFLKLLSGINSTGSDAIGTIQGLGISSSRDLATLTKASQNVDIFTSSLHDAATGAKDGTELNRQYAFIAGTVGAQLTDLGNSFSAFLDALGRSSTGIAPLIGDLNKILQWATQMASSPVGATLSAVTVALVGLAGISALAAAAFLRTAAAAAAVATAQASAGASGGLFSGALALLTGQTQRAAAAQDALAASTGRAASAQGVAAEAAITYNSTLTGASVAAANAEAKMTLLGTSMKALTIVGAAFLGIQLAGALEEDARQALGLSTNLKGVADALDQVNQKQIVKDLGLDKPGNKQSQADPFGYLGGQYGSLAGRAQNSGIAAGQDFNNSTGNLLGLGSIANTIKQYDEALAGMVNSGDAKKAADEFKFISDAAEKQGATLQQIKSQFPQYAAAIKLSETAAKSSTDTTDAQTQALQDNLSAITDSINATLKEQDALYALGDAIGKGGEDFTIYSANGRANLKALSAVIAQYATDAGGDSQVLANNLQGLFLSILKTAPNAAAALDMIRQAIAATGKTGDASGFNPASLFQGLNDGADQAAKALQKTQSSAAAAAKAVRTLVDYGNDLSNVFKRSFDIRFSGGEGLDAISSGWQKIQSSIASTNADIKKYQDTMQQLTADKAVTEYWLKVANNYGDTLRAGELQAQLAQQNADLATNTKDLSDAQAKNSMTLDGNSEAAITNRATILGLVGNYEDYIAKLAASGASQETLRAETARLKADFISQATQLGFNQTQLGRYAAAFDDVTTAVNRVPRNITVTGNADPAIQALNELEARAKQVASNVGSSGYGAGTSFAQQFSSGMKDWLLKTPVEVQAYTVNSGGQPVYKIPGTTTKLFADGGYTGDGGKYDPAGIVHAGEFVFSQDAVRNIGIDNLSFLHNMAKGGGGSGIGSSGPQTMVVELSPFDRQLLADAGNLSVTIPGVAVAKAVSQNNVSTAARRAA